MKIEEYRWRNFKLTFHPDTNLGAIIMCPADTIKTRIQFQGGLDGVKKYTSGRNALTTIWKEEGILGFTRGTSWTPIGCDPFKNPNSIYLKAIST